MSDERQNIIELVDKAQQKGARQSKACEVIGLNQRTLQRWKKTENNQDGRVDSKRVPSNKLSEMECQRILKIANEPEYAHLPPNKIVPKLTDNGIYIASESTFYRVLKAHNQHKHREKSKPKSNNKPKALAATGPNQLYSWDITYLPSTIKGMFFFLYMVMDVYSRKIVGWQVHDEESSILASDLITDICKQENITRDQITLHSDNGGPMKGATMLATLQKLGIVPSFSRPAVSNDNPFSESLFRTLKYRPEFPEYPFKDLAAARQWVLAFVRWYNHEHLHSAIKYVTPAQRHTGEDQNILAKRIQVYKKAKQKHPERWSGDIRNWTPINKVFLNPEKGKTELGVNKAA